LYILDLLAVFAENSIQNLMPATNLAAIFQPGLLSHPNHDMNPQEYKVSQEVLIFLIQHQDRFLPTTAAKQDPLPPVQQQQPPQNPQSSQGQRKVAAPPAKYVGSYPPAEAPASIPRSRTFTKKSNSSPTFAGKVLRRHRSTRTPQSPKLVVGQEEPRRVSEGSAPNSPAGPGGEEEGTPLVATFSRRRLTPPSSPSTGQRESSFDEGREDGN
jgi:GTPase-activating protein SAC7